MSFFFRVSKILRIMESNKIDETEESMLEDLKIYL